jgi:hypothetical protein
VIIEFVAGRGLKLEFPDRYDQFILNEGVPDLSLKVHYAPPPERKPGKRSPAGAANRSFYRDDGKYIIMFNLNGDIPAREIIIDADFRRGEVYIPPIPGLGGAGLPDLCIHPKDVLDRFIFTVLLSRRRGVVMHGCGVVADGEGMLFTGLSGAGKSTLADLWEKRKGVTVIGDERIVARQVDGRFWIYGTPWYSTAMTFSPLGAPLKRVWFIRHSPVNQATPLGASEAIKTLLTQSFSDFSEPADALSTLDLLGDLAEQVPCFDLGFVPDESVLEYVREIQ